MPKFLMRNEYYCVVEAETEEQAYEAMQIIHDDLMYFHLDHNQTTGVRT